MTKSSQELSPNLVTFSSPQFSPFQAVRQKNHHIGWNNKWQNRHPKCHQIWWQFCHLNSHQFGQFTEIFTRMGDNPAENPIENVLGLLPLSYLTKSISHEIWNTAIWEIHTFFNSNLLLNPNQQIGGFLVINSIRLVRPLFKPSIDHTARYPPFTDDVLVVGLATC